MVVAIFASALHVSAADYEPDFDYLIDVYDEKDNAIIVYMSKGEEFVFESFWGENGDFFSSDEDIAKVKDNGTVTAKGNGTVYIAAISSIKANVDMIKIVVSDERSVTENYHLPTFLGDWNNAISLNVDKGKVEKEAEDDGDGSSSIPSVMKGLLGGNESNGFTLHSFMSIAVSLFIAVVIIICVGVAVYKIASDKKHRKKTVERNAEIDSFKVAFAELEAAPSDQTVCKLAYELETLKKKGSKPPVYERGLKTLYREKVFDDQSIKDEFKLRLKKAMASHGISGIDPVRFTPKAPDPVAEKTKELERRYSVAKAELENFPSEENAKKYLAFLTELKNSDIPYSKVTGRYGLSTLYRKVIDNNADITEETRTELRRILASFGVSGLGEVKIRKIEEKKPVWGWSKSVSDTKVSSGKKYESGEAYGQAGEDNAWFQLCEVGNAGKFNAFSSVRLPYSGNSQAKSQELDGIVVCRKGVFLIEIKSYSHKKTDEYDESRVVTYDDVLVRDSAVATQISAHKNAFLENFQIDKDKVRSLLLMSYPKDSYKEIDISTFPRDDNFYSLKVSEIFEYLTKYDGPDVLNDTAIDLISHNLTKFINKKDGKVVTKWVIDKKEGKPSKGAVMPAALAKRFCPECGTENRSEAVCCRNCGHKFE